MICSGAAKGNVFLSVIVLETFLSAETWRENFGKIFSIKTFLIKTQAIFDWIYLSLGLRRGNWDYSKEIKDNGRPIKEIEELRRYLWIMIKVSENWKETWFFCLLISEKFDASNAPLVTHTHTHTHTHTSKLKIGSHYWLCFLFFLLSVLFV